MTPAAQAPGPDLLALIRRDPLGVLRSVGERDDELPRFLLGATPCVLVRRPEQVRELLVEQSDRLGKPTFLLDSNRGHWGEGLTTLEGEAWRRRRALLRPAFTREAVAAQRSIVGSLAREQASRLARRGTVNLRHELRAWVGRVAARLVLDAEVEGFGAEPGRTERSGVLPLAEVYGEDFTAVAPDAVPLALTRPRAPPRMPQAVRIIEERIASPEPTRPDVLSRLLAAGLERDAIVDELVQMLYAGHHTVVGTLVRVMARLAAEPELLARAREDAAQARGRGADADATPSFVEQLLRETMRVHAPAPLLYREAREPVVVGGTRLAPGTAVWVAPMLLHHDPSSFPEPDRFRPDRFARGASPRIPAHAYLPFGAGPRVCIAQRGAMQQMEALVVEVARSLALRSLGGDRYAFELLG